MNAYPVPTLGYDTCSKSGEHRATKRVINGSEALDETIHMNEYIQEIEYNKSEIDPYYTDEYNDKYHPRRSNRRDRQSYYYQCCGNLNSWHCLSILNSIGLTVAVILFIIFLGKHSHSVARVSRLGDLGYRRPQSSVRLKPEPVKQTFKFRVAGIYSRYPSNGDVIRDLAPWHLKSSNICCYPGDLVKTSIPAGEDSSSICTGDTKANADSRIKLTITMKSKFAGSFVMVEVDSALLNWQCVMTWIK